MSLLRGVLFTGSLYFVLTVAFSVAIPFFWHPPTFAHIIKWFAGWGLPLFLWAGGVDLRLEGRENVAELGDGPYVLVANHSSFIDPVLLIVGLSDGPNLAFVIKKEMRNRPMLGRMLTSFGYFEVDRTSPVALKRFEEQVKKRIAGGWTARLGIFPEGTRSIDGQLQQFHVGPFLIASQLGIPILPVVIRGANTFQPPNRLAVCPGPVRVQVQPAIAPPAGKRTPMQRFEDALEMQKRTEAIFHAIPEFTTVEAEAKLCTA